MLEVFLPILFILPITLNLPSHRVNQMNMVTLHLRSRLYVTKFHRQTIFIGDSHEEGYWNLAPLCLWILCFLLDPTIIACQVPFLSNYKDSIAFERPS